MKSEAIIARREPKEEVEDVSSYLCTELVYSTINMRGTGGGRGGAGFQGRADSGPYSPILCHLLRPFLVGSPVQPLVPTAPPPPTPEVQGMFTGTLCSSGDCS